MNETETSPLLKYILLSVSFTSSPYLFSVLQRISSHNHNLQISQTNTPKIQGHKLITFSGLLTRRSRRIPRICIRSARDPRSATTFKQHQHRGRAMSLLSVWVFERENSKFEKLQFSYLSTSYYKS